MGLASLPLCLSYLLSPSLGSCVVCPTQQSLRTTRLCPDIVPSTNAAHNHNHALAATRQHGRAASASSPPFRPRSLAVLYHPLRFYRSRFHRNHQHLPRSSGLERTARYTAPGITNAQFCRDDGSLLGPCRRRALHSASGRARGEADAPEFSRHGRGGGVVGPPLRAVRLTPIA